MKKFIFLTLFLVGCGPTIIVGTPSPTPLPPSNTPEATVTPTVTLTVTQSPTDTPAWENPTETFIPAPSLTPTVIGTLESPTPTRIVEDFDPTEIPTPHVYIYKPSETEEDDSFIEVIADIVNVRRGGNLFSPCVTLSMEIIDCEKSERYTLSKGNIRTVYLIYYDAELKEYWARINNDTEAFGFWVSANTYLCRNSQGFKIFCSAFK